MLRHTLAERDEFMIQCDLCFCYVSYLVKYEYREKTVPFLNGDTVANFSLHSYFLRFVPSAMHQSVQH